MAMLFVHTTQFPEAVFVHEPSGPDAGHGVADIPFRPVRFLERLVFFWISPGALGVVVVDTEGMLGGVRRPEEHEVRLLSHLRRPLLTVELVHPGDDRPVVLAVGGKFNVKTLIDHAMTIELEDIFARCFSRRLIHRLPLTYRLLVVYHIDTRIVRNVRLRDIPIGYRYDLDFSSCLLQYILNSL